MKRMIPVVAVIAGLSGLYACSHNHTTDGDHTHDVPTDEAGGHSSPYPSCNAITQACHKFDVGEGAIHDCHELGHGATGDGPCAAQKASCLALCADEAGADGGNGDGGDSGDSGKNDGQ